MPALAYYYENKGEIDEDIREDIRIGLELAREGRGRPEKSLNLRLRTFMQDEDFRSAISDAVAASDENRPALIKALFAKMDAMEHDANEEIVEHTQKSSE